MIDIKKCNLKPKWIKAELEEHGNLFPPNKRVEMAKAIACGHVRELGRGYYPALFKMERQLRAKR